MRSGGLSCTETGRALGVLVYSVSRMIALARIARETDEKVESWMAKLERRELTNPCHE